MAVVAKLIPRRNRTWTEIVDTAGASLRLPANLVPYGLEAGSELDAQAWEELTQLAQYHALYDRALRILGRREHFCVELRRKLDTPGVAELHLQRVLAECRRLDYLNDERAADNLAAQLVGGGGIGRAKLRSELLSRGCPQELVIQAVAHHAGDIDETEEVAKLLTARRTSFASKVSALKRKLTAKGHTPRELQMQLKQRLSHMLGSYLLARGFSSEAVYPAIRRLTTELLGDGDEA